MEKNILQNNLHYALNRYLRLPNNDPVLCNEIVTGYQLFEKEPWSIPTSRCTLDIPAVNLADYAHTPYKDAMEGLFSYIKTHLSSDLISFLIHGSLCDLAYVKGFSDLDTYLFIKSDSCSTPEKLDVLRVKLHEAEKFLAMIEPHSHHGFIVSHEIDMKYYCGAYMPLPVLRSAKNILGEISLPIYLRDSKKEYTDSFNRFKSIISNTEKFGHGFTTKYELKYFVSVLLLMPSLHLQARDIVVTKKQSLELYTHPFLKNLSTVRHVFEKSDIDTLTSILGKEYFSSALSMLDHMQKSIDEYQNKKSYSNVPIPMDISIYDKARNELREYFASNKDVEAIYEYGSVRSPGISDLDLIVVTRGNLKYSTSEDFKITKKHFTYATEVAPSTLMVMPIDVFENIHYFDDHISFKLLYGNKVRTNILTDDEKKTRLIISIVDWLPERLGRLLAIYKKTTIDAQYSLRYIRSFTYSLELVSKATGDTYYQNYSKEVSDARNDVLAGKTVDIRELTLRGIYAGYEALTQFTKKFFSHTPTVRAHLNLFPWQNIYFSPDPLEINPDLAIARSNESSVTTITPSALLPHFVYYKNTDTSLSKQMTRQFTVEGKTNDLEPAYMQLLYKKIRLAERNASYLRENGFEGGLFRFGFFFKKRAGL